SLRVGERGGVGRAVHHRDQVPGRRLVRALGPDAEVGAAGEGWCRGWAVLAQEQVGVELDACLRRGAVQLGCPLAVLLYSNLAASAPDEADDRVGVVA